MTEWGPAAWNTLHVFAHSAPHEMSEEERERMKTFLRTFATYLPCPSCREHFHGVLDRRLTEFSLSGRSALVEMLNDAHNEVNARLGKRIYTLEEHYAVYARPGRRSGRMPCSETLFNVLSVLTFLICLKSLCTQKKIGAR